jgi:hypothetical protein
LILLLRVNGFTDAANFLQGVLMAADQLRFDAGSCTGQQPPVSLEFAIATLGADFFPNPQTTYLETSGFCFQPGKAVVVTGRAPVFPDTYSGASVFDPAPPFNNASIQLRYWSMCNNNREIPYAVVGCKADFETAIQNTGSQNQPIYTYTYIVSADLAPPDWLPENTNWLPWGATDIAKNLIFRGILPQDPFALTNHYYPHAVFCDVDRTFRPVSPLPVRGCNRRDDFEQPDVGWLTRQGLLAISMLRSSSFLHSSSVCSQS